MKAGWFVPLLIQALLSGAQPATPIHVGQAAPSLKFTQLLQAPQGAKADWQSLRGKVVVLEFWATWCSPCIEQIPHLNSIVRSIGSDQVQFIAIDDQPVDVVKKFVAKFPISGWLGIDTTAATIRAFDAQTRPRTVVVDRNGRIAGILQPDQLSEAMLLSLVAGHKTKLPANVQATPSLQGLGASPSRDATAAASGDALFDISVRAGDPNGQASIIHGELNTDAFNLPVQMLGSFMGLPLDRIRWEVFPAERYSLHLVGRSGSLEQLGPAVQLAVANVANLRIVHKNDEEDVWILQSTMISASLLEPASPGTGRPLCMFEANTRRLVLQQCSLTKVAEQLEYYLHMPVLNETGIDGEFSGIVELSTPGFEGLKSALEQNLGLTLSQARRPVERITFTGK